MAEITLKEALKEFEDWGVARYASSTINTYTTLINKFIEFTENKKLENTDITDVNRYFSYLKKNDYHSSSIARMMISLRQMFFYFKKRGLINWDWQLIGIPPHYSKSHLPVRVLEVKKMIDKISEQGFINLRNRAVLAFLSATGVRVSELTRLKTEDLKERHAVIFSAKNFKPRMIPWNDECNNILKKYLEERKLYAYSEYVFISTTTGGKLTTRQIERIWAKYRDNNNQKCHGARHGLGTDLTLKKVHPKLIMDILGHKNIISSQVYMQVNNQEILSEYDRVRNCG